MTGYEDLLTRCVSKGVAEESTIVGRGLTSCDGTPYPVVSIFHHGLCYRDTLYNRMDTIKCTSPSYAPRRTSITTPSSQLVSGVLYRYVNGNCSDATPDKLDPVPIGTTCTRFIEPGQNTTTYLEIECRSKTLAEVKAYISLDGSCDESSTRSLHHYSYLLQPHQCTNFITGLSFKLDADCSSFVDRSVSSSSSSVLIR